MKYFANFSTNNGTRLEKDLESTNKKELAKEISLIARGNCLEGNEFSWLVYNEKGIVVAAGAGRKTENGFCYYSMHGTIGENIYN